MTPKTLREQNMEKEYNIYKKSNKILDDMIKEVKDIANKYRILKDAK